MSEYHEPVLLNEVIEGLKVKRDGIYIDATAGGGGHTEAILNLGGRVLALDHDEVAITHLKKKFESEIEQKRLILVRANFVDIAKVAQEHGINAVDGILFDLGLSSYQIDKSGRGFSFSREEKLDMRMDERQDLSAFEIANSYSQEELTEIFEKFGEEREGAKVAAKIVEERQKGEIATSKKLGDIVASVIKNTGEIHPATRIFQALRIAVNDEMGNLRIGLSEGFKLLLRGARMEIISFHSLEDRVVKLFFINLAEGNAAKVITKKPIRAQDDEVRRNRRSRSAKLRIAEKI